MSTEHQNYEGLNFRITFKKDEAKEWWKMAENAFEKYVKDSDLSEITLDLWSGRPGSDPPPPDPPSGP